MVTAVKSYALENNKINMDVPDQFDSKEEVKQYIGFLHDRIQFLEEELTKSEQTVLELQQDQSREQHESVELEEIIEELEVPDPEQVSGDLSVEDFERFEDEMLHDPEEVINDTDAAIEEVLHAASQLQVDKDALERVRRANERMRQNIDEWFGDKK